MFKRIARFFYAELVPKAPPRMGSIVIALKIILRDHFVNEYKEGAIRIVAMQGENLRIQRLNHRDIVHLDFLGHELLFVGTNFFLEGFTPILGYVGHHTPKKGDIVVDGGAYVGFFTVIAAKLVGPTGRVLAFEPDPSNFEELLENIRLNGIDNVIPIKAGLLDGDSISLLKANGDMGSTLQVDSAIEGSMIEIQVVSLDNEIKRRGIDKVDFIKLDVEGSECRCLIGSSEILEKNDVKLAIASYHIVDGDRSCARVEQILRDMGYRSWTEYPSHLTTYGERHAVSPVEMRTDLH